MAHRKKHVCCRMRCHTTSYNGRGQVPAASLEAQNGSFDLIFFDWDMYLLSLMGATAAAAAVSIAAFEIAISNLSEVTQTRSCYGMVMNKRAALGSASSDSNDRCDSTEPNALYVSDSADQLVTVTRHLSVRVTLTFPLVSPKYKSRLFPIECALKCPL